MKPIFTLFLLISLNGFSQEKLSKVLYFDYGGFGDTCFAFLTINIDCVDLSLDSPNTRIIIEEETGQSKQYIQPNNSTTYSFELGFYTIWIIKDRYDLLKIENYYAVPDQFSRTKIQLSKGNDTIIYRTEPPKYLFPKNGTDTTFYDNGQIKTIEIYKNNELVESYWFFEDGKVKRKQYPLDESLIYLIEYYQPEKVKFIAVYNKRATIGFRKEYYENGKLKEHLINTESGQKKYWEKLKENGDYLIKEGKIVK